MAFKNKISSGANETGNTGIGSAAYKPKHIAGGFLCPKGFKLSGAQLADLQNTLNSATHAARASRIYPIHNFKAINNGTQEPTRQTFGYGDEVTVRDGKYIFTFELFEGGITQHKEIANFSGGNYSWLHYDADGVILGTDNEDDADGIAAIPLTEFYVEPFAPNDGSNVSRFPIRIVHKTEYLNKFLAFAETADEFNIEEIAGLQNVVLTVVEAPDVSDKDVVLTVQTKYEKQDLLALYETELEQTGAWDVKDADGVALTVSSAAVETGTDPLHIRITCSSFGGTAAGEKLYVNLKAPATLKGLGSPLVGYEGIQTSGTAVA